MIITKEKINRIIETDAPRKVYIDGNTVITKKAYDHAVAHGFELIHVNSPVINQKRMDVMKDPGVYLLRFLKKLRSR